MALVMEVKTPCGGVGRIFDDCIIKDPKAREKQKRHIARLAGQIWREAQLKEGAEHGRVQEQQDVPEPPGGTGG